MYLFLNQMFDKRQAMVEGDDAKAAERAGRRAAILVPLCIKEGKPAVLFTVRSNLVSTHKGQVWDCARFISPVLLPQISLSL